MHKQMNSSFRIVQLIYCSHVTASEAGLEFERDLRDILDHSQAYNSSHEITGALMTDGGMFAHVVEGPSVAVMDLYSKVRRDKRHNRVLTLHHTLVHVRLFSFWPITFLRVKTIPDARALNARSTPTELRRAYVSILKAFRPVLLR